MKASIHLFYGIIIGVLATLCMGSIKTDKAEFKEEKVYGLGTFGFTGAAVDKEIANLKKEGWTIIDIEMEIGKLYAHIGR